MKNFIIYDINGVILRSGTCAEETFLLQVQPGEFLLEGVANDYDHMIINGEIVKKEGT
jgi:hypothetical protein